MPFCGQRSSPTEGLTPRFRTCVSVGPTRQPNVATDGHEAKPFIRERQNVTQLPAQGALSPCWERTPRLGLVSTNNYEHSDFVRRRWTKRRSRWRPTEMDHEITVPTSSARGILRAPAPRGMPWHEEVRSDQTTARADQALDERRGDPERRVRHHFERAAREAEIGHVSANDCHVALIELIPQIRGALWMQLNRNNPRSRSGECASYRSSSRTDVEDEVTGDDASVCDDAVRPTTIELMPPPPWPADRGHGGPSP